MFYFLLSFDTMIIQFMKMIIFEHGLVIIQVHEKKPCCFRFHNIIKLSLGDQPGTISVEFGQIPISGSR